MQTSPCTFVSTPSISTPKPCNTCDSVLFIYQSCRRYFTSSLNMEFRRKSSETRFAAYGVRFRARSPATPRRIPPAGSTRCSYDAYLID